MSKIDSFNTPDIEEVLQEDSPDNTPDIPVCITKVKSPIPVEEMPTRGIFRNKILRTGVAPDKLVSTDPRRKTLRLSFNYVGSAPTNNTPIVCIGGKSGDTQNYVGAILFPSIVYTFTEREELWVRPGTLVNSTTTLTSIAVSTNDIVLTIVTEQWTN